jgi:hypothetical protein
MRVCIETSTGKLIEAQSGDQAPLDTLLANALAAGYAAEAVEVKVVDEETYQALLTPSPALDEAKKAACARIDARAEALRLTVLTPGSGQMSAYLAKEAQATAYLQDADPTEAEYPDLYNEVGITADTVHDVAMAVLAAAETWRIFGRAIERARLSGKKAVREAIDLAGVAAAEAGVVWPTEG